MPPGLPTLHPRSVHARENEGVVAAVLPEAAARGFRLEAPFPSWPRRGVAGLVDGAEKLVRVDPDEDGTDGFFVALFVRDGQPGGDSSGEAAAAAEQQHAGKRQLKKQKKQAGEKKKQRQQQQQQQQQQQGQGG